MDRWYPPREALKLATADNAELLALPGQRRPDEGVLAMVEEGALADLLVVDGNSVANLTLLEDADKNLLLVRKDEKIYKHTVGGDAK